MTDLETELAKELRALRRQVGIIESRLSMPVRDGHPVWEFQLINTKSMTSRERFEAYCVNWGFIPTGPRWNTWQAAERDMLERAIALFDQPHKEYFGADIRLELKELLNEQR